MSAHATLKRLHGPWMLDARMGHVRTQPAPGRPHGAVVGSIGHHPNFIEETAIGPLFAAAPSMLNALIQAKAIRPENWDDMDDPDQRAAWLAVDAAIADAMGDGK